MRFLITLQTKDSAPVIPVNYQYPLSSAIYRIIAKGDQQYASFLHSAGYGKGFKFFCFSQIRCPFEIKEDRLYLLSNEIQFTITFHLPITAEHFVKGLFEAEAITIADTRSKAVFSVRSVKRLPDPLQSTADNELKVLYLRPLSPIISGLKKPDGKYDFLGPDNPDYIKYLLHNWRSKIETCYDKTTASNALLLMELIPKNNPPQSRLITIKAGTKEETRIRGWTNFSLKITSEKRFAELLLNAGCGLSNSQGMGCVEASNQINENKEKLSNNEKLLTER